MGLSFIFISSHSFSSQSFHTKSTLVTASLPFQNNSAHPVHLLLFILITLWWIQSTAKMKATQQTAEKTKQHKTGLWSCWFGARREQLWTWRCRLRVLWELRKASCAQPWMARAALHSDHTISAFNGSHRKRGSLLEDFCFLGKGRLLFCFHALNAFRKLKSGQNEPWLCLHLLKTQIFWGGDSGHSNQLNSHLSWRTDRLMGLCAKNFMAQEGSWIPCGLSYPLDPQYMGYRIGMSDVRAVMGLLRGSDGLDYKQALFGLDWLIPSITFSFSHLPPSSL